MPFVIDIDPILSCIYFPSMHHANNKQLSLFPFEVATAAETTYFIIISPEKKVMEVISLLKEKLLQQIPLAAFNLQSAAHISLLKFSATEDDEQVIEKVQNAVSHYQCFEIELDGDRIFEHGKVAKSLVINILHPDAILLIQQSLLTAFKRKQRGVFTPHVTIARDIPNNEFKKINLSAFEYHDSFLCKQITILKKKPGESYQRLAEIPLQKLVL